MPNNRLREVAAGGIATRITRRVQREARVVVATARAARVADRPALAVRELRAQEVEAEGEMAAATRVAAMAVAATRSSQRLL